MEPRMNHELFGWKLDERVELNHADYSDYPGYPGTNLMGRIIGGATIVEDGRFRYLVIVKLDEGFYNPQQTMYVSCIVASNDSVRSIDR